MITNTRYLGVQIDSKLNWDKHIDTIKTKANRALGLIKYYKKYLPSDVLNKMYRGIIVPFGAAVVNQSSPFELLLFRLELL